MQIQNWSPELSTAVERRCAELSPSTVGPILWQAATVAEGLPVYGDLGDCLVIQKSGRVLMFDLDTGTVRQLEDERWLLVALSSAAERYPEFEVIKPTRPDAATDCSACGANGRNPQFGLLCAECMGLGWISLPPI